MRRLAVPGGLVQKDGLGQSDVPRRYLDPEEREMPRGGGRCSKSVTWAPHGITAVSSGQEEWSGRLRHQGEDVLWGLGGMQRVSSSQIQFWFQEVQGPLCFPGVSKEPLSLLG